MNVVITGASRGLGKAVAEVYAAAGANLFLCSRNPENLDKTAAEFQKRFNTIQIFAKAFNLSFPNEAKQFGEFVLSKTSTIDVLVNNAGVFVPGNVHDEPDGVLEEMISVNLYSAYYLTKTVLPTMIQHKNGHIFNMCSIASLQAYQNGGSYSISKFALAGFSKNLREEMKLYNIKVTTVYPGAAYTDSWAASGVEETRLMRAKDIADMIFAASKLSSEACVEEIILRPQKGDL